MAASASSTEQNPPSLFINYRREDTQSFARDLYKHLAAAFGYERVFMDTVEMRAGDEWEKRLEDALERSTVVVALIGPRWLTLSDHDYPRRIDKPTDWVRRELSHALANGKKVIALYVGGSALIEDRTLLPEDVVPLLGRQAIVLTEASWDAGMAALTKSLETGGLRAFRPDYRLPTRLKDVAPYSNAELAVEMLKVPRWTLTGEERKIPYAFGPVKHSELYCEYAFARFEDATAFMAETSAGINRQNHHPRWENFWTTVRVWLSTWDIEFKPSKYDIQLAKWLDEAYVDFKARLKSGDSGTLGAKEARDDAALVRLEEPEVLRRLKAHPAWTLNAGKLERTLRFDDFQSAFGFMASVAVAAEGLGHHPTWSNHFNEVSIQLATNSVAGISANDFKLAARIDALQGRGRVR